MPKHRTPFRLPPRYDIDVMLDADLAARGVAFGVVDSLWTAIEDVPASPDHDYFRPDTALLTPEIVVADIWRFQTTMGNGFSVSLGHPGGILYFSRALRSLRLVGHRKAVTLMESVRDILNQNGYCAFTTFPDDPTYGWFDDWPAESGCLDWETEQRVQQVTGRSGLNLDSQWWALDHAYWDRHSAFAPDDPPLSYGISEYLDSNREPLRCRKQTAP